MAQPQPETNIIIPRNYGVVIQSGSNSYFYDPARYIIGHVMLSTQAQLFNWLKKWQEFKKNETEQKENQTLSYTPKFPSDGIEYLLGCSVEDIESALLKGIQRTESSKNLWVVGGKEAVKGAKLYGRSLEGRIKSKSKGFNDVHITNPFLGDEGIIQHADIYCSAPDGNYESQKYLRVMCSHAADLETAQFMQLKEMKDFLIDYGKRNTGRLHPTLAFDFVSNPFLSSLEVDVLISHYVKGETLYDINRRLLDIPDHYSAALNRTADVGKARFAVMRQKTENLRRSKTYQINENRWVRKIRGKITELDFERMPFYTIVFKDSPFEMVAERYEKGNEAIELACSPDYAPLIIRKRLYGDANFHGQPLPCEKNPFLNIGVRDKKITDGRELKYAAYAFAVDRGKRKEIVNIGEEEHAVDDCTRRKCNQRIFVPNTLLMPQHMQSVYRRAAREARRELKDKSQIELDFGVVI